MKTKQLIPIISIVSVLVMFVWSYLEGGSYQHSWLAVFAGGIVITILSIVENNKKKDGGDGEN